MDNIFTPRIWVQIPRPSTQKVERNQFRGKFQIPYWKWYSLLFLRFKHPGIWKILLLTLQVHIFHDGDIFLATQELNPSLRSKYVKEGDTWLRRKLFLSTIVPTSENTYISLKIAIRLLFPFTTDFNKGEKLNTQAKVTSNLKLQFAKSFLL